MDASAANATATCLGGRSLYHTVYVFLKLFVRRPNIKISNKAGNTKPNCESNLTVFLGVEGGCDCGRLKKTMFAVIWPLLLSTMGDENQMQHKLQAQIAKRKILNE